MYDSEYYSPALLLGDEWQWAKAGNKQIQQWILWYVKRPSIIYASVVKSTIQPDEGLYRTIVRNGGGLISMDEKTSELVDAMTAAETHVMFNLSELIQENKA